MMPDSRWLSLSWRSFLAWWSFFTMKCGAMNCKPGALPRAATPCQNFWTMRDTKVIPRSGTYVFTLLSRFSNDPVLMQVFHLGLGVAAIFVLCRYAPFTRWQKGYLAFGYFFFYEYLIVSRNYALGVLALVAFCAIRAKWPDRMLTCCGLSWRS